MKPFLSCTGPPRKVEPRPPSPASCCHGGENRLGRFLRAAPPSLLPLLLPVEGGEEKGIALLEMGGGGGVVPRRGSSSTGERSSSLPSNMVCPPSKGDFGCLLVLFVESSRREEKPSAKKKSTSSSCFEDGLSSPAGGEACNGKLRLTLHRTLLLLWDLDDETSGKRARVEEEEEGRWKARTRVVEKREQRTKTTTTPRDGGMILFRSGGCG